MKTPEGQTPHRRMVYLAQDPERMEFRRQRAQLSTSWPPMRLRISRWWNAEGRLLMLERPAGLYPIYLGKIQEVGIPNVYAGTISERDARGFLVVIDGTNQLTVDAFPELELTGEQARAFAENHIR